MQLSSSEKARLKNRYGEWAIITGASSGIGLELATQLADAGFNLAINSRHLEKLQAVERNLKAKYKIEIKIVDADVSEMTGIDKLIHATEDLNVGLLINSAGYGTSGLFLDTSLHSEINMLRVNSEAVLSLTHHYSQKFKQKGRGGIIFLSSLMAFQGVPYSANYSATKAYIQTLAEALAVELKPFGIDVLAAAPGPVDSGFGQRANMKMGQAAKPSEIGVPILKALGRKTNVIPGLLSKFLVYSLRTVPRWAKIRIMQKVMGGYTEHQRNKR
jgi:short-subunit dehydrogenase